MLTRLIVDIYAGIIEIFLWLFLVSSGVAGYLFTIPILNAAGWALENEIAWKVGGGLLCAVGSLLVSALLMGPFLMLVDIRQSLQGMEISGVIEDDGEEVHQH